ncbi:hypothetical protein Purlil1_13209 [Purpureocillium lilacinum]|uniref:LysM domain-containing protein n=1 Tax=Purpureocillium lilacinum TaxID=33203 RepID=A0ABR0BEV9_PURLI|nr:hypothetical protein Purlil1_13209 [Purpureocillium lilacinum]
MIWSILLSCAVLAGACIPDQEGIWIVEQDRSAFEAARLLGIQVEALSKLNPGRRLDMIYPGDTITVPYVPSVAPPATWKINTIKTGTKADCRAYLEMSPSTLMKQTKPSPFKSTATQSSTDDKLSSVTSTSEATSVSVTSTSVAGKPSKQPAPDSSDVKRKQSSSLVTVTGCSLQKSLACAVTDPSATQSSTPLSPTSIATPTILCTADKSIGNRTTIDQQEQKRLATAFCQEDRNPLSPMNPSYLRQFVSNSNFFFFSMHWAGWDRDCSAEEKIDKDQCSKRVQENFIHCNNGGAGGFAKEGCIIYEFQGFQPQIAPPAAAVTSTTSDHTASVTPSGELTDTTTKAGASDSVTSAS